MHSYYGCFIVPRDVLEELAADESLSARSRQALRDTGALEPVWRQLRTAQIRAAQAGMLFTGAEIANRLASQPESTVFNCKNTRSLPGAPVLNPDSSSDETASRAHRETLAVADFYAQCFGRNSVDNAGMTLVSSIHYDVHYSNAFWNGTQMTYGDGDGEVFVDFTASTDVIGHELTHGVTQFTAGLNYTNEAGGLNESVSDVFGTMFRQWRKNQTVDQADWLIGADIIGPKAAAKGYTCLRDMADPGAQHCLSRQPGHYRDYVPGGDPHTNSGIPNRAFYLAAKAIGGQSWEKAGKAWYAALTSPKATPNMKMKSFANLTRSAAKSLFAADTAVYSAIDAAWEAVGIA
ncbi:M4 family metallopeptidase [Mycobacterium sp. pW045]|uniref:M4 family metallopeptidase n=1 Tax=Mycobacterium sp. pW045 TaxID=3238984 RepID=UPI00351BCF69